MVTAISDPEWAIDQLQSFLDRSVATYGPGGYWVFSSGASWDELEGEAQVVEQIVCAVLHNWIFAESSSYDEPWDTHRKGAIRAITQIQLQDTIEAKLGTPAPTFNADRLHPWIWDSAKFAWLAGSHADAVRAAARGLNAKSRQKLTRKDASEWRLLENAFSVKPPTPAEPRLRLTDESDLETFKSLHMGAGALARGLYMAVRNPANHEDDEAEIEEHVALEQLAAFSVLARFVDAAEVERPAAGA